MWRMTGGMLLLTGAAIMVYCGLLQRVLDRMHLRDRTALLLIGAMLLGTFLPNLPLGRVQVNIGGGLIPLGVCGYLFIRADEAHERWRTLLGSLLTAAAVYGLTLLLPAVGFGVNGVFLAEPISNVIGGLACYTTMRRNVYKKL